MSEIIINISKASIKILGVEEPRPMIKYVGQRSNNSNLIGVEIGTWEGRTAYSIMSHLPMKQLFCIDPYLKYDSYGEVWNQDRSQDDFNHKMELAKHRLKKFNDKIVFIRKLSSEAVDEIPDNLDFVYTDGNHSYKYVKKDIELYYPKVKLGGVIGGHNYEAKFYEVSQAVLEFVDKHNLKLFGMRKDWWIHKSK